MDTQTKIETATDGRRLVKVTFTEPSADPAKQPDIQVTFWLKRSDAVHLESEPFGLLGPISVIRTDTGETVSLTKAQLSGVFDAAVIAAAEDAGLAWG